MEQDTQKMLFEICAKTVGFDLVSTQPLPKNEFNTEWLKNMEAQAKNKKEFDEWEKAEASRMPYVLTQDERETIKGVIKMPDEYIDKCSIYKYEDGDICVESPQFTWFNLTGREWKINLENKTGRLVRMS